MSFVAACFVEHCIQRGFEERDLEIFSLPRDLQFVTRTSARYQSEGACGIAPSSIEARGRVETCLSDVMYSASIADVTACTVFH